MQCTFCGIGQPHFAGKVIALLLLLASGAKALTLLSGPTFTPSTNAPLAGVLSLTTDAETRVRVVVDGGVSWSRDFFDFNTSHSIPLFGFKPNQLNSIYVTVLDRNRNQLTADQAATFRTPALPADFPRFTLLQATPELMEPGFTLFRVAINGGLKGYNTIVDEYGEVVWYNIARPGMDVRQLANGNLLTFTATNFFEMDLLGQTVNSWVVPSSRLIDNHEALPTERDTLLYISTASTTVNNYPSSVLYSNAPTKTATNVIYARVTEISLTNSTLLHMWSMINMLDPRRITYLTTLGPSVWDSEHANAIIEDPKDDSIIVSLRHQNAVVKFSRATGQPVWILGPPENWGPSWQQYLLTPVGLPFAWQYGQHAPVLTPQGNLLLYDNGNFRATPFAPAVADPANYSRAVEYHIDEETMQVSQVWEYGSAASLRLYTDRVGSAEPLPQSGNILVTFGSVRYVNGAPPSPYGPSGCMARIQEVTHDPEPQVLFDLALTEYDNPNTTIRDCYVYRCRRIPDLYSHPRQPVGDLTIIYDGMPRLEFSADPVRTYSVETSTDLTHWEKIGTPWHDPEHGIFHFEHQETEPDECARFYRVATD